MSACFYNSSGTMLGVDVDKFIMNVEGAPFPVPHFHSVAIPFEWAAQFWPKSIESVTMDRCTSFQGGMDFYLIPHVPWPIIPAHGDEATELLTRILTSGSKAWMSVHKVHVGGDKAATCIFDCVGTNQNCGWPVDLIVTNMVVNFNSVITSPSQGDYVGSFVAAITDSLIGGAMGHATGRANNWWVDVLVPQVWRRAPDAAKETGNDSAQTASDPAGKVQQVVQQWVDGEQPSADAGKS